MAKQKVSNGERVRKSKGKPDFERVKYPVRQPEIDFLTTLKGFLDYSKPETLNNSSGVEGKGYTPFTCLAPCPG